MVDFKRNATAYVRHGEERRSFWVGSILFVFTLVLSIVDLGEDTSVLQPVRVLAGLSFGIAVAYLPGVFPLNSRLNTRRGKVWMRAAGAVASMLLILTFHPHLLKHYISRALQAQH